MTAVNMRFFAILMTAGFLLLIPYAAMKLGLGFDWTAIDFIAAGVLLFGAAIAIEVVLRLVRSFWSRVALCAGVLAALMLLWAELAVGIFGTPFGGS